MTFTFTRSTDFGSNNNYDAVKITQCTNAVVLLVLISLLLLLILLFSVARRTLLTASAIHVRTSKLRVCVCVDACVFK